MMIYLIKLLNMLNMIILIIYMFSSSTTNQYYLCLWFKGSVVHILDFDARDLGSIIPSDSCPALPVNVVFGRSLLACVVATGGRI